MKLAIDLKAQRLCALKLALGLACLLGHGSFGFALQGPSPTSPINAVHELALMDKLSGEQVLRRLLAGKSLESVSAEDALRALDPLSGGAIAALVARYSDVILPSLDRLSAGDALRSLNKLSEGALLAAFAGARGGDIARSLIAYENMANGDHLPKRTGIDPLAGIVLGLKKRSLNRKKRNFDEIDRSGFRGFAKKNFDEIDRSGFRGFQGKRNFDEIDRSGFRGFAKKNFDEIDRSGFRGFAKKNFDEIDRSGFSGFNGKRNFDEIDRSGFSGFAKRNFDEINRSAFGGFNKRDAPAEELRKVASAS